MRNMTIHQQQILGRSDAIQQVVLATGSSNAQAFDTPAGASYVSFSLNADFWVTYGSTGVQIPGASSAGSTGSEMNPTIRDIGSTLACTGISIASEFVSKGSITWYKR